MEIKAAEVMKLRKMTGAGMMDCKKALAVHHAGARALAQLFNNFCTDFHRNTPSV